MKNTIVKSLFLLLLVEMSTISLSAEVLDKEMNTTKVTEIPEVDLSVETENNLSSNSKKETESSIESVVSLTKTKKRRPLKIEGKKLLPLRVLARPFSNIYKDQNISSEIVQSDVPAMQPFYVYTRPSAEDIELESGWYEIGTNSQGKVVGWMHAKDVFEWKQTMCLVYTHPEGRKPVLMFDTKNSVKEIIQLDDQARSKNIAQIYKAIDENNISKNFVVKSVEPKRAIDIQKEFYLLPILDFEAVDFGNREARLVKLAAVTNAKAGARDNSDIRSSETYLKDAVASGTVVSKETLKKLAVDIVWVFDTTVSMRPYIRDTLAVIKEASEKMANAKTDNIKLNFGAWGYRDSLADIPKIGYNTKNYTPNLVGISDFTNILSEVKVTQVDSVDFAEDMFSGISDAMDKTSWTDESIKLIILVGDAPSHEVGHKWNLSGQNEETLRSLANDSGIYIASLHLKNPKSAKYHELAEVQYRALATNPGSSADSSAFIQIATTDKEAFKNQTVALTDAFIGNVQNLRQETTVHSDETSIDISSESMNISMEDTSSEHKNPTKTEYTKTTEIANQMFQAALIKWIGSQTEAKAPRDVVAWSIDKDLENPDIPSLEVRLLLNKRQLDSLSNVLTSVINAGATGSMSGDDFFTVLQSATATIARDPNMVKRAKVMADTGLVPEFLEGLPYKSQLMAINNELWGSWSADEQMVFIDSLAAKVEAYKTIHDSPEGWIALNKGDDLDEYVYPISLELLP